MSGRVNAAYFDESMARQQRIQERRFRRQRERSARERNSMVMSRIRNSSREFLRAFIVMSLTCSLMLLAVAILAVCSNFYFGA